MLGIAKAASMVAERDGSFRIDYTLRVTNFGQGEISGLTVEDDLAAVFRETPFRVVSVRSETAAVRSDYDGQTVVALLRGTDRLPAGHSLVIALAVRVIPTMAASTFVNSAVARGVDTEGRSLVDTSQDGADPDPDWDRDPTNNNSPTPVEVIARPRVGAACSVVALTETSPGFYNLSVSIVVENFGQLPLSAVSIQQDLLSAFPPPAEFEIVEIRSVDFALDPGFDGRTRTRLLGGTDSLAPGERDSVTLKLRLTRNGGGAWFETRALAFATAPDGTIVTDVSNKGSEPDPDGDGDPGNDDRATDILLATTSLTGFAETTVRVAALPLDVAVTSVLFNALFRIDGFAARLDAKLTNTIFDVLTFATSGLIGNLSTQSSVAFNPSTLSFVSWQTTVALDAFGIGLSDTLYLAAVPSSSYNLVRVSGDSGTLALEATLRTGICPLGFWDARLCADWNWGLCETPLSACALFTCAEGFSSFELVARDVPMLESVLGLGATLDIALKYTTDAKTLTPTLRVAPNWVICPEIVFLGDILLATPDPGVSAIRIYGARIDIPVGNVVFRVADSFSDDKNAFITGKAAFFESFSIETSLASCCGSPGRIKGSVYFERSPAPSGSLFGVGLLEGLAEFQFSQHIATSFAVEFRPTTSPNWLITVRLRALW